jgi:hypothetical protein
MIRLIWISDTEIKGIFYWFLKRISYTKEYYRIKGEVAEEIMGDEYIDFMYLDIQRRANTDMMDMLCLRYINRLRVSVFKLKPLKSRILKFLFPPDLIKTIAQNIINYKPSDEKREIRIS